MHPIERIIHQHIQYEYEPRYVRVGLRPHIARELLTFNTLNRPISQSHVDGLAAAMRDRAWRDATRGLVTFSDTLLDGTAYTVEGHPQPYLADGQHRLTAIGSLPGGSVVVIGLQWGADPDVRYAVDRGKARRGSDILSFEGVPHANDLEAIARKLVNHDRQFSFSTKVPPHQLQQFLRENVSTLERGRKHASLVTSRFRAPPSVLGLCFVLMGREDATGEHVARFATALAEGTASGKADPVHLIRDRLLQGGPVGGRKDSPEDQMELLMRSWRAWRSGERLTKLQLPRKNQSPVSP